MKTVKGFFLGLCLGLPLAAFGQNPQIHRASRFKILMEEGRLKDSKLLIKLRQDQRFTSANSYFVSVVMIDSTTADRPDSVRTFVIKNLSPTQFIIRSVKYVGDTVKVRWLAIGK